MKRSKEMKHRDIHFQYFDSFICYKWYDSKAVLLLNSDIGTINGFSSHTQDERLYYKKKTVTCQNIANFYNKVMMGMYILLSKR